jgi:hypothetical protein
MVLGTHTWRRVDACRVEDLPHRGGADPIAESDEFAVNAPIPPGGVLGGKAHGQGADTGGDGRAAGPRGRGGPATADQVPVPAQNRSRGDQQPVAATSG